MQRVLASLVPTLILLFLYKALTPGTANATREISAAQLSIIRFLSIRLAGGHVSDEAVGLAFVGMALLAGVMGYVLHVVLQDHAFGPRFNGLLCFLGAAGADAAFVTLAPRVLVADPSALVMISTVGAVCLLLFVALIKAALLARLDDFSSGARFVDASIRRGAISSRRISEVTKRV